MRSMRSILPAVITLGTLIFATAAARAQRPGPPAQQPAAQQPQPPMQSGPQDDAYRGYEGSDYPAYEVNIVPGARANAVRARLEMELIQTNMHRLISRSWDDFLHNKDYIDAAAAEKRAADEYARERERVMKRLREDSNYRALDDMIADLKDKIEHERPSDIARATQGALDNFMALATMKLSYASQLSAMEASVMENDNGVRDAAAKMRDAAGRTRDMRRGFDREMRRNPDFLAARANFDEARINRVVSSAYLESLTTARCIALDYAYWVHRWDQYRYSTGYYPYGYGYSDGYYPAVYHGAYMRRY